MDTPDKIMSATVLTSIPLESWPYDDGLGDPWWEGGVAPKPYRWQITLSITELAHGSHVTPTQFKYNGMDIEAGDWIGSSGAGICVLITKVIDTTATTAEVIVEDLDRYNTFESSSGDGIFSIPQSTVIFTDGDDGLPLLNPLPPSVNQVTFMPQVQSRFLRDSDSFSVRIEQDSHGLVPGDSVWVNPVTDLFEKAIDPNLEEAFGLVVKDNIGPNVFFVNPLSKVLRNVIPILPGSAGDKIYVDDAGILSTTPGTDSKLMCIQGTNSIQDLVTGTVPAPITTAGNELIINDEPVVLTGGVLAQSVFDINTKTGFTGVVANSVAASTSVITNIPDLFYGLVGLLGDIATATINGVLVNFDITTHGTIAFATTAADEFDMVESINLANIPNIVATQAGGNLTITNTVGGLITIVNGTPDTNTVPFGGTGSGAGVALTTLASTDMLIQLTNASGLGIILRNGIGTPMEDLGIISKNNGRIPIGISVPGNGGPFDIDGGTF